MDHGGLDEGEDDERATIAEKLEKFAAIDVTDSDDPEIGEEIAQLQARHLRDSPELAARGAQAPSCTVPSQPSAPGGQTDA